MDNQLLPTTNADGLPIVPMTEAQRYTFDVKGWICLPGLLSEDALGAILEHQHKVLTERESLPPEERNCVGGPSQILLDHPVLAGILNEIVSHQGLASEECYGSASSAPAPNDGLSATITSTPMGGADTST